MPDPAEREDLEARRDALEAELRSLTAGAGALSTLDAQIAETREALLALRRRLDALEPVRRLPLFALDELRVASPCAADWERMAGDDRVRFCGECRKDVFNLSAMTRAEAEALLLERAGRLCVRFYRRSDGTVLTADCPVGARKKRVRRAVIAAAGAGAVAFAAVASIVGLRPTRETCALRAPESRATAPPRAGTRGRSGRRGGRALGSRDRARPRSGAPRRDGAPRRVGSTGREAHAPAPARVPLGARAALVGARAGGRGFHRPPTRGARREPVPLVRPHGTPEGHSPDERPAPR